MKNSRKILALLLSVVMLLGVLPVTAIAAETSGMDNFKKVNTYSADLFSDVSDSDWFVDNVKTAYELGLMIGQGKHFGVASDVTIAETVTLAARLHSIYYGNSDSLVQESPWYRFLQSAPWYQVYVDYVTSKNLVSLDGLDMTAPATRAQFASILFASLPAEALKSVNKVADNAIPDVSINEDYAKAVYALYRAGILIGNNSEGTFAPYSNVNRSEVAAIVTRMADSSLRKSITLGDFDSTYDPIVTYRVSFNLGIDGIVDETALANYAPQQVVKGRTAKQPVDPLPIIGDFAGWYTSKDYDTLFDFSTPISADTTVYAKWYFDTSDSDGDNLPDDVEAFLGLDPTTNDTDGDGLMDRLELEIATDPKLVDTDGDGIGDYDEDFDGDGLTNGEEVELGTSPLHRDTDLDRVNDYDEVNTYKTNPNEKDSDDDGAEDGWEIESGFDPLVYNEAFVVEEASSPISEMNPVSVSVSLELPGEQVASIKVTPMDASDSPFISASVPGYLGHAYDFSTDASFESATIQFTYDTSLGSIGDAFQPRVYYFNEAEGTFEELPDQIVEDGCITVNVNHFSTYILLNKVEFDKVWEEEIRPPVEGPASENAFLDMMLLIDCSGSMGPQGANNDPQNIRLEVSRQLVEKTGESDQVAVISFGEYITLLSDFTNDKEVLYSAINSVGNTDTETYINKALKKGFEVYDSSGREDAIKYMILLTDGKSTDTVSNYADNASARNITIFTVGLGSNLDENLLRDIATSTGGKYFHASVADDLYEIFDVIVDETIDYTTDSNGDNISDYYTKLIYEGKLRPSNGSSAFKGIDLNYDKNGNLSNDYDGDGLTNGEELVVYFNEATGRVYLTMLSDPTLKHSDNDGVDDFTEVQDGQNPLKDDYYRKSEINNLLNDANFYYEDYVTMYDNSGFYQLDSAFLSVITGLWNSEGLYRELMIQYFDQYGEATLDVDEVSGEISDNIWLDNLDRLLGLADEKLPGLQQLITFKSDVKNLIDVVRGHSVSRELIAEMYYVLVEQLAVYIDDFPVLVINETTIGHATVTALKKSPLKTFDTSGLKLSIAFDLIGGAIDITETVSAMSKLQTNYAILSQNIDFLNEMYKNGSRPALCYAAEDLVNSLGEGFESVMVEAIGEDVGELTLNIAKSIASCNPYVGAVTFVINMLNLATGLSDTLRREYQMLCYSAMVDSLDELIYDVSSYSGNYHYDSEGRLYRYLVHLAQIRILGENKYIDYYSHGANTWFNDEQKIAKNVKNNISWIKETAIALHLRINKVS